MNKLLIAAAIAALPVAASAQLTFGPFSATVNAETGEVVFFSDVPSVSGIEIGSASGSLLPANAPIFVSGNGGSLGLPDGFGTDPTVSADLALSPIVEIIPGFFNADETLGLFRADAFSIAGGEATANAAIDAGGVSLGNIVDVSLFSTEAELLADIEIAETFGAELDGTTTNIDFTVVGVIPEPATAGLLGTVGLAMLRRRRAA
jgi:hypothetical protein